MKNFKFMLVLLILATIATIAISLCIGRFSLSIDEVLKALGGGEVAQNVHNVVMDVRLPRIIAAVLVGAALGISGTAYQGVFKNQLVSPDLLGVSAGACVGAAIAILLDLNILLIQLFAFVFGLAAVCITLLITRALRSSTTIMLVLAGIIVSGLMGALIGFLKFMADPETKLADIVYWQLGSLAKVDSSVLAMIAPVMGVCIAILVLMSYRINVLSMGDATAAKLGVNVVMERGIIIVCATLLTASSVCISGIVAWVGLLMPHLTRMIVGVSNTKAIPASIFLSAIFVLIVDDVARSINQSEIPLGVLTGFIGTLFFIFILLKNKRKLNG